MSDWDCRKTPDQICIDGACEAGTRSGGGPELAAINGNGTPDGEAGHASHHFASALVISGVRLSGIGVTLRGTSDTRLDIDTASATDTQVTAWLPPDLAAGQYVLRVENAAGFDQGNVTILEGERGPAGDDGPQGPEGAEGPRGPPGVVNVVTDTSSAPVTSLEHEWPGGGEAPTPTEFTAIGNFSVTISPSSETSRILILANPHLTFRSNTNCRGGGVDLGIVRDGVQIALFNGAVYTYAEHPTLAPGVPAVVNAQGNAGVHFVDTPNTVWPVAYTLEFRVHPYSDSGIALFNGGSGANDRLSTLTAMDLGPEP